MMMMALSSVLLLAHWLAFLRKRADCVCVFVLGGHLMFHTIKLANVLRTRVWNAWIPIQVPTYGPECEAISILCIFYQARAGREIPLFIFNFAGGIIYLSLHLVCVLFKLVYCTMSEETST